MATYRPNDHTRNIARCATCAVMAEADCHGGADANTVCARCGLPMVYSLSERDSYFEVVMRLGCPGALRGPAGARKLVSIPTTLRFSREPTPPLLL
jgi:hypothetical protein